MDFAELPPEINSGRMYAGAGSGPMLAAAAAWDGLATELHGAANLYGSLVSGLTAGSWLGPASTAMAAAAGPHITWMRATATQAEQAATQAEAAAAAYEVAFAATVPPPVIAANRAELMALVATNLFGQNTAAIAAVETQYAEMWAQDAATMYGYAGVSASAATLTPFTPPPPSVNAGGLGSQAPALVLGAATSAATNTQTVLTQLTSAVPAALQGLASPVSSTSAAGVSLAGLLPALQALGTSLVSPSTLLEPAALGLGSSELTTASGAWADAAQGDEEILENGDKVGHEITDEQRALQKQIGDMDSRFMSRFGLSGAAAPATPAGLGKATLLGALSVPPGWTAAAPEIRLSAFALPATSLAAAPEAFAASPAGLFSQMALASMAGRAIGGPVGPVLRERTRVTTPACPVPAPKTSGGPNPAISEMREVAELLCKLGSLRDSGILTGDEFSEQKRRLLEAIPAPI